MVGGRYLVVGRHNTAICTDKDGLSWRACTVRFRYAIGDRHSTIFVAQEIIRKGEFVAKCSVNCGGIIAYTNDSSVSIFKVLDSITEPVAFDCSAGCIGLRVPPEQNVTAHKIIFVYGSPILVWEAEIWRISTDVY